MRTRIWKAAVLFMVANVATFFVGFAVRSDLLLKVWFFTYPIAFAAAIWIASNKRHLA